ncbi:hypothetical protein LCGC14_1009310 [marine sediment metagenome]|uniref:Uncharacterized protein n=1 Tax=marine sediment metagenome TaxID=412755 RepID=A0A0F9NM23_9ZZZZ|nr:hypothetical protein [Candidatus Aminicenantes bacterium]
MTTLIDTPVNRERYRATTIRKFPDSLKERLWKIKEETDKQVTLETIIVEALKIGLPKIEHRILFRIPDFVEEPRDD